jgi:hypothetical protein
LGVALEQGGEIALSCSIAMREITGCGKMLDPLSRTDLISKTSITPTTLSKYAI